MTLGTRIIGIAGVALALATFAPGARAQGGSADITALREDMAGMRKSVDQLVVIFKEFKDEAGRMNRASLLLRRIELAEKHIATLEDDLRVARTELKTQQDLVTRIASSIESNRLMQLQDRTGASRAAFEAERATYVKSSEAATQAASEAQTRVFALEQDIGTRKSALAVLEAQLDGEMGR